MILRSSFSRLCHPGAGSSNSRIILLRTFNEGNYRTSRKKPYKLPSTVQNDTRDFPTYTTYFQLYNHHLKLLDRYQHCVDKNNHYR